MNRTFMIDVSKVVYDVATRLENYEVVEKLKNYIETELKREKFADPELEVADMIKVSHQLRF